MKKLIKWSFLIGLIVCLLGVGMITAGAMMGGGEHLISYMSNHHYGLGWLEDDYEDAYEDFIGDYYSWGEETEYLDQLDSLPDQREVYDNIRKLDVEAAVGMVKVVEESREDSEDTTIQIGRYSEEGKQVKKYTITQENDELKIECKKHGNYRSPYEIESIVIYIPEGYQFRKVEVETLAGAFNADVLNANEVSLELKAGEINIGDGNIDYLDVESQAGRLQCDALVTGSADVECQAGMVNISLAGSKDDYNYELECKTGSITLTDTEEESYNSLWEKKYIDHRADKTVELDCAAGKINIYFPDTV